MTDYTPTTAEVREEWIYNMDGHAVVSANKAEAQFDRWLRQVAPHRDGSAVMLPDDEVANVPSGPRDTLAAAITRGIDRGLRDVGADLTGCAPSLLSGWVIRQLRAEGWPLQPTEPYTPTTAEVRKEWIYSAQEVDIDGNVVVSADEAGEQFDRWLRRVTDGTLVEAVHEDLIDMHGLPVGKTLTGWEAT